MQSKISLVNKELWKTITRSVGWVSIVYFLGFFIAIPLEIMMTESKAEEQRFYSWHENLFEYHPEIQSVLTIALPVLLAIFLFRFLQVKQYSDFMHSLPIKRAKIYHIYALTGTVMIILPILLNAIIVLAIFSPLNLQEFLSIKDIFIWLGVMVMFNLLIYMATVFVGMVTGLSTVQGALTYIVLLLPIGLIVLLGFNLPFYLFGFPDQYFMENKIESFSPLVSLSLLHDRPLETGEIVINTLLIFIFYFLSLWVYKQRKLEAVSQSLIFPFMKPIFKYGTTFCFMLLGGMYLGRMEGGKLWLFAGYFAGAIIGYFIAEMVLQKSWRIVIHIRGLFIYSCAIAVLVVLFQFDFTQYEKRIPYASEIEKVHFGNSYYRYRDDNLFYLQENESIEMIRQLHKGIIANKGESNEGKEIAFFAYELKNGHKVIRQYKVDKNQYASFYKLIYESDEYKRVANGIFQVKTDQVEKISIYPYGPVSKRAVIIDPSEINEAIKILKDEINGATYEDMQDTRDSYSHIEITQRNVDKTVNMEWRVSYKKFEQWLNKKGLLENARINASDIEYAYIAKKEDIEIDYKNGYSHEEVFNQMKNSGKALKVTDKAKLELCLENTKGGFYGEPYIISFYYKDDRFIDIKSFTNEQIPEFVKLYFQ